MTPETLCSEPVVAWAVSRGRDDVMRESQYLLWRLYGTERAVAFIAEKLCLEEIEPSAVQPGDAVLLQCRDGALVLGVNAGEFSVAAQGGRVHVGRFAILRAWGLR